MPTADIYGFNHEDMEDARSAIESALSICMEEVGESTDPGGSYFRWEFPYGPCVQIRRNSGPYQRWHDDPPRLWHPNFKLLVFVHGKAPEAIAKCLQHSVPGLLFLESKETMC